MPFALPFAQGRRRKARSDSGIELSWENLAHRKIVARPGFGVYNACGPNSAPPRSA
jgi:hypothetical protein